MSGRVLIVDSIATNRIILRAMLQAAHYDVTPCATIAAAQTALAADAAGTAGHDIALIDICGEPAAALALCAAIKADPAQAQLRVIALAAQGDGVSRIAALRAGADDVLDKDMRDGLLLARIRSLLRARNAATGLALRDDADRAHGFAEAFDGHAGGFTGAGRVALITARPNALPPVLRMVMDRQPGATHLICPGQDMVDAAMAPLADLYIIDGALAVADGAAPAALFQIVSDLRARAVTQHAALLVMLPPDALDLGGMALDLGANDQVSERVCVDELAYRVRSLTARKLREDRQRDQLQNQLLLANTDGLTGLHNRRHAMRRIERMVEKARGSGQDMAVMMLDIDHFKAINDTYGHATGDRVLTEVARRLRDNLRAVDLVARYGGEEFVVAMPDTTVDQAHGAAERLRRTIAGSRFDCGKVNVKADKTAEDAGDGSDGITVTMSIGVAIGPSETPPGLSVTAMTDGLFERADIALYAAKSSGRNMVTVSRSAA